MHQGVLGSDVSNHICSTTGMAGVSVGQNIDERSHQVHEKVLSGVSYYLYEPELDIRPFEHLIVGLTPLGRQVFSIRVEMHGKKEELKTIIEQTKKAIGEHHTGVTWEVIGNHHYGSGIDGLDVTLYMIGDYVQAKPTFLLTYDCDSLPYRKLVIDERHKDRYTR